MPVTILIEKLKLSLAMRKPDESNWPAHDRLNGRLIFRWKPIEKPRGEAGQNYRTAGLQVRHRTGLHLTATTDFNVFGFRTETVNRETLCFFRGPRTVGRKSIRDGI
jgi:hypothetical protein